MGILSKLFGRKDEVDAASVKPVSQPAPDTRPVSKPVSQPAPATCSVSKPVSQPAPATCPVSKSASQPTPATRPVSKPVSQPAPAVKSSVVEKFSVKSDIMPNTEMNVTINVNHDIPPYQGEYAQTVFLMQFEDARPEEKDFPQYLLYECGITDSKKYFSKMVAEGFLRKTNLTEQLAGMKLEDLKKIASQLGLPVSGKKDKVLQGIADYSDQSTVSALVPPQVCYILSNIGVDFIKQHFGYTIIHRHRDWGVTWQEFDEVHYARQNPYSSIRAVLERKRYEEKYQSVDQVYRSGRGYAFIYSQMFKDEKMMADALDQLIRVQYLDISGLLIYDSILFNYAHPYTFDKNGDWVGHICKSYSISSFAPGIVTQIISLGEYYDPRMIDRAFEDDAMVQICPKELFIEIIESMIHKSFDQQKYAPILEKGLCDEIKRIIA